MIKQNVNFSMFFDSFSDTYKNNFTYEGKRALFHYLENLSEETGEDIELDIVSICCDYTEFANFEELLASYPDIKSFSDLEYHTTVITIGDHATLEDKLNPFIIQNY